MAWSSSGYPLFGTRDGCSRDSPSRGVRGVDLVCLQGRHVGTVEGGGSEDGEDGTDCIDLEKEASLLLFQQSLLGDVHCQRILLLPRGSSCRAPVQLR